MALSLTDNDWQVFRNALGTNDSVANRIAALLDGSAAATRTGAQTWSAAGSFTSTLNVTGALTLQGGVTFASGAQVVTVKANTAAALTFNDGTVDMIKLDSRNTVTAVIGVLFTVPSPTIAGAAGSVWSAVKIAAKTITTTTQTTVTALNGTGLYIGGTTVAQSGGAVTVSLVSGLYVEKPIAGSSVTLTANYLVGTDTAGCFCTAAGAWTDTSSEAAKENIKDADHADVLAVLDAVEVKEFSYKDRSDGGHRRFGGIAEHLPDELSQIGRQGVAARDVAWLAVGSVKALRAENADLLKRIEKLEKKKVA